MGTKNTILGLLAMTAALSYGDYPSSGVTRYEPRETEGQRKARLAKFVRERNRANGLTEFFYGTNSLWALTQSVADRKAVQRGWV